MGEQKRRGTARRGKKLGAGVTGARCGVEHRLGKVGAGGDGQRGQCDARGVQDPIAEPQVPAACEKDPATARGTRSAGRRQAARRESPARC